MARVTTLQTVIDIASKSEWFSEKTRLTCQHGTGIYSKK